MVPGVGDGQAGLAGCGSWGRQESDTTEPLNWTELDGSSRRSESYSFPFLKPYASCSIIITETTRRKFEKPPPTPPPNKDLIFQPPAAKFPWTRPTAQAQRQTAQLSQSFAFGAKSPLRGRGWERNRVHWTGLARIPGLLSPDWFRPSSEGAGRKRRAQSGRGGGEATLAWRQLPFSVRQIWISLQRQSRAPAASIWKSAMRWPRSARNCSWTSWRSKSAVAP